MKSTSLIISKIHQRYLVFSADLLLKTSIGLTHCLCGLLLTVLFLIAVAGSSINMAYAQDTAVAWGQWSAWGDQGDGTYCNPVIPADFSDIDCIRVGADYYAISSTMQFSPGMVILHSRDMVNWSIIGHAVSDLTQIGPELNWDRMNRYGKGIWAGSIRYAKGRYWVLFGTPNEGYFITSAEHPAGPWQPLKQLLAESGWDDCSALWDEDGQAYFVGTQFAKNYTTYIFKMAPDGTSIDRNSALLVNEGSHREANKLIKVGKWYYLVYSRHIGGIGRYVCAKRAERMAGPWSREKQLAQPDLPAMQPNQGGIIDAPNGQWYFFTHHGTGQWEGRAASLLPVTWIDDWPIIGKVLPDGTGSMVWNGKMPVKSEPTVPQTSDEFDSERLAVQWEWNYQPRAASWSLTEKPGWLRLRAFRPLLTDDLLKAGNTLTQRSYRTKLNEAVVKLDMSGMADGQRAGLCHFAQSASALGVCRQGDGRRIEYQIDDRIISGPAVFGNSVWLKSTWGLDGKSQYSYSFDGREFTVFGEPYQLSWGFYRGDRIGIYNFNNKNQAGFIDIDWFHYQYSHTQ